MPLPLYRRCLCGAGSGDDDDIGGGGDGGGVACQYNIPHFNVECEFEWQNWPHSKVFPLEFVYKNEIYLVNKMVLFMPCEYRRVHIFTHSLLHILTGCYDVSFVFIRHTL